MAPRQVCGAEEVGGSDAEGKTLAVGSSQPRLRIFPPQVAVVWSPGEEAQGGTLA